MKVISGPTEWSCEKTCGQCKAVLKVEIEDVFMRSIGGDYTESGTDWVCAACMVCGTVIQLFTCLVAPPKVLEAAMKDCNHD